MVNESYGVLINLIGDRYIVASESERSALKCHFQETATNQQGFSTPYHLQWSIPCTFGTAAGLEEVQE
jgi:hypothetical protein